MLSQWTGCYRDNSAAHLDLFADILNRFRVFYYCRLARTRGNRAKKESENCLDEQSPVLPNVRIERNPALGRFLADVPKSGDPFKSEAVNKLHVYDDREKFP